MGPRRRRSLAARGAVCAAALWLATVQAHQNAAGSMPPPAPPEAAARRVNRDALMAAVRTLSAPELAGRRTGTPGAGKARDFLVRQLTAAGLEPPFAGGFVQPFRMASGIEGANVAGLVPGREPDVRAIIVSAHYDHLGIRDGILHPGADDNASGVAVLLAAATYFARHEPRHPMYFAAFDAEELMLAGARAFLRDAPVPLERIAINVNLDMLGRSERREIVAAGSSHTAWLLPILRDVQLRASVRIVPGRDRPGTSRRDDWTTLSDHAVFHRAGLPFLYFGVEDHADYHGPGDTADRIDPGFFGDVADAVLETLIVLDRELDPRVPREPFPSAELSTGT